METNNIQNENPSLCIPRILENVSYKYIRDIFEKLKLGNINRIDIIERKTERGSYYKRVFIHFHNWYTNETAKSVKERIFSGKDIKIVHNNPWFWKVSMNKYSNKDNNKDSNKV